MSASVRVKEVCPIGNTHRAWGLNQLLEKTSPGTAAKTWSAVGGLLGHGAGGGAGWVLVLTGSPGGVCVRARVCVCDGVCFCGCMCVCPCVRWSVAGETGKLDGYTFEFESRAAWPRHVGAKQGLTVDTSLDLNAPCTPSRLQKSLAPAAPAPALAPAAPAGSSARRVLFGTAAACGSASVLSGLGAAASCCAGGAGGGGTSSATATRPPPTTRPSATALRKARGSNPPPPTNTCSGLWGNPGPFPALRVVW